MRVGKTRRDHSSGAWANHRRNKDWRRHENGAGFGSAWADPRR